jgi:hypothetical protein
MLKRHEVEILLKAGHPKTEVAHLTGVSICSEKRIAEEAPVVHVDDLAEREKRRIGRPSIVEGFRKRVAEILEEKTDLPSLEVLRRVREAGYQGGKTALYALVASLRPKGVKPLAALHAERTLPLLQDHRRVRLHVTVDSPAIPDRFLPRAGLRHRRALSDPSRQGRARQDSSGSGYRVSSHPKRL